MIIFRADANAEIGAGHVMRCLSLADAAAEQGTACHFILAQDDFAALVRQRGFACTVLHTDYTDLEAELPALAACLRDLAPACIIADSYFVTPGYLSGLQRLAKLVYLDDVVAFAYPVDRLINYNIFADAGVYQALYHQAGRTPPPMLLGPYYAPLRGMFRGLPPKHQPTRIQQVLVSTGGADALHIALGMARYMHRTPDCCRGRVYHFVLGAANPDADEIQAFAAREDWLQLHRNVQDMAALMCRCDAAISAAGSTLYELCACGVPTVTYALADNQLPAVETFAEKGLMLSVGDCRTRADFFPALFAALDALDADWPRRRAMVQQMRRVVDAEGAAHTVQALLR